MFDQRKIILGLVLFVLVLAIGFGGYAYYQKNRQIGQKNTDNILKNSGGQNPKAGPEEELRKNICNQGEITTAKTEKNQKYLTGSEIETQSKSPIQDRYNDYLFCKLFSGAEVDKTLQDFKTKDDLEEGFSSKEFAKSRSTILNAVSIIFKSKDCNSAEVAAAVAEYKKTQLSPDAGTLLPSLPDNRSAKFKNNLANISSTDFCGFLKREPRVLEKIKNDNFCLENTECRASLEDDLKLCDEPKEEDDKKTCVDGMWHLRALRNNDESLCANVKIFHKNIACKAYFLEKRQDMCNGLAENLSTNLCRFK